jgi:hypothetical protein
MAGISLQKRADTLAAEATWKRVASTVVGQLRGTIAALQSGEVQRKKALDPEDVVQLAQVGESQVALAMQVQMLWAQRQMSNGKFLGVRLYGLGTFLPMTKKLAEYEADKGHRPGEKPATAVGGGLSAPVQALRDELLADTPGSLGAQLSPQEQQLLAAGTTIFNL